MKSKSTGNKRLVVTSLTAHFTIFRFHFIDENSGHDRGNCFHMSQRLRLKTIRLYLEPFSSAFFNLSLFNGDEGERKVTVGTRLTKNGVKSIRF